MKKFSGKRNPGLQPDVSEQETRFGSGMPALGYLTAIFFLNFMARIVFAPLMPAIEQDLCIGHGEAGSLFLFISAGYFVALLCSGIVSSRLMHNNTIIVSAVAVGSALLITAASRNAVCIRLGLLLLGLGAGIYLPSGMATLTAMIHPRHWGKAIAVHELAPNLSFVAAPVVAEAMMMWVSWRGTLAGLGIASLVMGMAFARFGRGGNFPGDAPDFHSVGTLIRKPSFWIMMIMFSLAITGTLGIFTMLPLYLVSEEGVDRNRANSIIALSRIAGLGMAFAAGWASDRLGPKKTMSGVFLCTGMTTLLLGQTTGQWLIIMIFLQPLAAACFFPPGFAALSAIGPASARNVAVSMTIPVSFLFGGGIIPACVGLMADAGLFHLGITLVGVLILTGFVFSLFMNLPGPEDTGRKK